MDLTSRSSSISTRGPLHDTVAAFLDAQRIFELDPHDHTNRERLLAMAVEVTVTDDVWLKSLGAPSRRTEESGFRRELAGLPGGDRRETAGGGADRPRRCTRRSCRLDSAAFRGLPGLTRFYRDAERWERAAGLVEVRQQYLPEAKERLTLLWQVAEIDEVPLEDRSMSSASCTRSPSDPTDLKAYRALEKHYAATARWSEFDALLERELALVSREGGVRAATLRRADRPPEAVEQSGALDLLEEVVAVRPQLARNAPRGHPQPLPEHRQRSAAILEPL